MPLPSIQITKPSDGVSSLRSAKADGLQFSLPSPGKLLSGMNHFDMMRSPTIEPTHVHPLNLGESPQIGAMRPLEHRENHVTPSPTSTLAGSPYMRPEQSPAFGHGSEHMNHITDQMTASFQHTQMMAGAPIGLDIATGGMPVHLANGHVPFDYGQMMPVTPLFLPPSDSTFHLYGDKQGAPVTPRTAKKSKKSRALEQPSGALPTNVEIPMMQIQPSLAEQRREKRRARNRVYAKGSRDRKRQAIQQTQDKYAAAQAEIDFLRAEVEKWRQIAMQNMPQGYNVPQDQAYYQDHRREKILSQ